MNRKLLLLAGVAAMALAACGKKEEGAPATQSSAAAARVDAPSPLDKPFKLSDAEAVDVEALFSLFPESVRPTYENATFDDALGATVVTNIQILDRDLEDDIEVDGLTVERAELYGVDMEAIDRVKAGEAAIDAPLETIFQKVRLFGVTADENDARSSIGAIEFDRFRLRHGGAENFRDQETPAHFFNAFDLAGLYFKDIAVSPEEDGESKIAITAPDIRLVSLGGGRLDAVIANDFAIEVEQSESARAALSGAMGGPAGMVLSGPLKGFIAPDNQRTTIESFEWRDINFSGLMSYGLKGEKPPLTATDLISLGGLKVLNSESHVGGRRAARVAETSIDPVEFNWLIPSKVRSQTKGAEYDLTAYMAPEEEDAIAVLQGHGLDKVKGGGDLNWDWSAAQGDAAFSTAFETNSLADFSMSLDLAGMVLEEINDAIEAGEQNAVMKAGSFKRFNMKLVDKKLLDAMFDIAALEQQGTGAELRQSMPQMVRLSGASLAALNPRMMDYVNAVADFLAEGGTLEISAEPSAPVPLEAVAAASETGPQNVPDLLNLTVTHTEK